MDATLGWAASYRIRVYSEFPFVLFFTVLFASPASGFWHSGFSLFQRCKSRLTDCRRVRSESVIWHIFFRHVLIFRQTDVAARISWCISWRLTFTSDFYYVNLYKIVDESQKSNKDTKVRFYLFCIFTFLRTLYTRCFQGGYFSWRRVKI